MPAKKDMNPGNLEYFLGLLKQAKEIYQIGHCRLAALLNANHREKYWRQRIQAAPPSDPRSLDELLLAFRNTMAPLRPNLPMLLPEGELCPWYVGKRSLTQLPRLPRPHGSEATPKQAQQDAGEATLERAVKDWLGFFRPEENPEDWIRTQLVEPFRYNHEVALEHFDSFEKLLRQIAGTAPPPESVYLGLQIDSRTHSIRRKGYPKPVRFEGQKKLWTLLEGLVSARGDLLSHEGIRRIWEPGDGKDQPKSGSVRNAICRLRNLLKPLGISIVVDRGLGYRLENKKKPPPSRPNAGHAPHRTKRRSGRNTGRSRAR